MPDKYKRYCKSPGCNELTVGAYCDKHQREKEKQSDDRRGSANRRGYTYRWQQYSKWYLKQPENVFCKLQLEGCTLIADCVDHIDPPGGPLDPKFWEQDNHQPACIHCNSVKGHTKLKGTKGPFETVERG